MINLFRIILKQFLLFCESIERYYISLWLLFCLTIKYKFMGSSKLSSETERIVFLDYLRVFAMFLVFGVHASESVYSDGTLNFLFKNETDRLSVSFMSSFSRYGIRVSFITA